MVKIDINQNGSSPKDVFRSLPPERLHELFGLVKDLFFELTAKTPMGMPFVFGEVLAKCAEISETLEELTYCTFLVTYHLHLNALVRNPQNSKPFAEA